MTGLVFILILLSYFDIRYRMIPNIIVLPMIAYGLYLTGYWLEVLGMFTLMTFFYRYEIFAGGDVKLMTMLAAFIGVSSLMVLAFSFMCLLGYKFIRRGSIPYTPFVLAGFLIFVIFGQPDLRMVLN